MTEPMLRAHGVSKMFGSIRALNEIDLEVKSGVTGLLGPNGSGKSTLLKLFAGQTSPDTGKIEVMGGNPVTNHQARRYFGLCPEQDKFYEDMTGQDFVYALTRLSGFSHRDAQCLSKEAIEEVGMTKHAHKEMHAMSRGMRQRIKIAQAIAPKPKILLLDEPLTGTDPVGRSDLIALFRRLGSQGACVLVSSHVLHEVEAMTDDVVFIRFGRLRARGNVFELRTLIQDRPHRMIVEVAEPRALAAQLIHVEAIQTLTFSVSNQLEITTSALGIAAEEVRQSAERLGLTITRLSTPDADLESVYRYLLEGQRA